MVVSISRSKVKSCLVDSIDQSLMKNRQIDLLERMTKKEPEKRKCNRVFPIATIPAIFQQIAPKNALETLWPNYRLSTVVGIMRNDQLVI